MTVSLYGTRHVLSSRYEPAAAVQSDAEDQIACTKHRLDSSASSGDVVAGGRAAGWIDDREQSERLIGHTTRYDRPSRRLSSLLDAEPALPVLTRSREHGPHAPEKSSSQLRVQATNTKKFSHHRETALQGGRVGATYVVHLIGSLESSKWTSC